MKARILLIAALFLAACQPVEDNNLIPDDVTPSNGKWTLTIPATKGDAGTKALDLEGNVMSPYWTSSDKVQVYKGGSFLCEIGVTLDSAAGDKPKTATLTGAFEGTLAVNDQLTLLIPRTTWNYTGQKGTLTGTGSIEDTYDYATATVTVQTREDNNFTTTAANFQNEQSIYRFTMNGLPSGASIQDFTISSSNGGLVQQVAWGGNEAKTGSITVTPAGAAGPYFVALRNNSTAADKYDFQFIANVGTTTGALFLASKSIPDAALAAPGKFLSATLTATQPDFSPASGEISSSSAVL